MKIVGKEIEKVPPTHLVTDLRRLLLLAGVVINVEKTRD